MQRLERKLGVELLWVFILALLKKKPSHAYVIRKKIQEEFGFLPGNVSSYVVLYKLESRGFVSTQKQDTKVIYSITLEGKKLLQTAKKHLAQKIGLLD
ncbi:MAG: PadR family transcriptional regulator [Candidatus Diapherotrites archaeon]|uniref:PadR family transcriptional regulator n=1 Tax=Candidatus Iainarchaeum sp. TaxID=3101447 RepID=A0A8T4L586_9ARCH|nr:PadR family transcriptional regulator [Candidatus Diapherotrites archaeon]